MTLLHSTTALPTLPIATSETLPIHLDPNVLNLMSDCWNADASASHLNRITKVLQNKDRDITQDEFTEICHEKFSQLTRKDINLITNRFLHPRKPEGLKPLAERLGYVDIGSNTLSEMSLESLTLFSELLEEDGYSIRIKKLKTLDPKQFYFYVQLEPHEYFFQMRGPQNKLVEGFRREELLLNSAIELLGEDSLALEIFKHRYISAFPLKRKELVRFYGLENNNIVRIKEIWALKKIFAALAKQGYVFGPNLTEEEKLKQSIWHIEDMTHDDKVKMNKRQISSVGQILSARKNGPLVALGETLRYKIDMLLLKNGFYDFGNQNRE